MQIHLEVAQLVSQTIKRAHFILSQAILICGVPAESSKTVSARVHIYTLAGSAVLHQDACTCCAIRCSRSRQKDIGFSRCILGAQENKWDENSGEYYCNTFRLLTSWHSAESHCHDFISRGPLRSIFAALSTTAMPAAWRHVRNRRSTDWSKKVIFALLTKVFESKVARLMSYAHVAALAFNRLIFLFVYKRAATQFLKALVHHTDQKKADGQNLHRARRIKQFLSLGCGDASCLQRITKFGARNKFEKRRPRKRVCWGRKPTQLTKRAIFCQPSGRVGIFGQG